jgi:hypothetical protein
MALVRLRLLQRPGDLADLRDGAQPDQAFALLRAPLLRSLRSLRFCASSAASSANICRRVGPKRGLLPTIPVIGCAILFRKRPKT